MHLDVVVYTGPMDGDLDGFVGGICDALQPPHPNFLAWLRAEDWADVPEPDGRHVLLDSATTARSARSQQSGKRPALDVDTTDDQLVIGAHTL